MPRWTVQLDGPASSLRLLAALAVGVTEEDLAFVFRSESLDRLTDSTEVRRRVGELIGVLNGLARMADYDFVAVSSSGAVGDDSGKTVVLAMPADMTQRGGAGVAQQRSDDRCRPDLPFWPKSRIAMFESKKSFEPWPAAPIP